MDITDFRGHFGARRKGEDEYGRNGEGNGFHK